MANFATSLQIKRARRFVEAGERPCDHVATARLGLPLEVVVTVPPIPPPKAKVRAIFPPNWIASPQKRKAPTEIKYNSDSE